MKIERRRAVCFHKSSELRENLNLRVLGVNVFNLYQSGKLRLYSLYGNINVYKSYSWRERAHWNHLLEKTATRSCLTLLSWKWKLKIWFKDGGNWQKNWRSRLAGFSRTRYFPVWFAKALAFLRIFERAFTKCSSSYNLKTSQLKKFNNRGSLNVEEFCCVNYFEILVVKELKMDNIDKKLEYVWLKWHRTPGVQQICRLERNTALFRFRKLVGLSTFFLRNKLHSVIDKSKACAACRFQFKDRVNGWKNQSFHVNRLSNRNLDEFVYD